MSIPQQPNPEQSQGESPENPVTQDLRKYAQDALRASGQLPSDADEGEAMRSGNTTFDIAKYAAAALRISPGGGGSISSNDTPFLSDHLLRFDVFESSLPIVIEVIGELSIGRADNVSQFKPDIDLTAHGAYRLGLSRKHALLRREGDRLLLIDLGSRNGTHLNGVRIPANQPQHLRDGDEIQFANLKLRVLFQLR